MKDILQTFQKRSPWFYFFLVFMGFVNSMLYSGILIFINNLISGRTDPLLKKYDWQIFLLLITLSAICTRLFQTYMIRLTNQISLDFELSLFARLRRTSFQSFERMGSEKVYTAINDTKVLSQIPGSLINIFNNGIVVICGVGYLFFVSWQGGLGILIVMAGLLIFYLFRSRSIEKDLNRLRDIQNEFYRYVRDLLLGFKEIKMSITRNENIYRKFIQNNRYLGNELSMSTSIRFMNNELTGSYSWYLVLAVVMFVLPGVFIMNMQQIIAFVITILYLIGPVATLITVFPFYTRAKVAINRIQLFEQDLSVTIKEDVDVIEAQSFGPEFESLSFDRVTFEYAATEFREPFVLGPLNFKIFKGETLFVTGGNGSGKSTFVNLITGLYKPTSGEVRLNGIPITSEKYGSYSNSISAIFTNNFLFNENYDDFNIRDTNEELLKYIAMMDMENLIKINEDKNFIDNNLSKGQQKRLAMVYALMENRQLIVLDEWAAEQDPSFREYFYRKFLKELQRMGKTIIAITHDDRYFSQASRIIKFEYGKIIDSQQAIL